MSAVRERRPDDPPPPDPSRRKYFDEYMERAFLVRLGVTYGMFVARREDGTWNEWAEQHLGGRGKVEETDG